MIFQHYYGIIAEFKEVFKKNGFKIPREKLENYLIELYKSYAYDPKLAKLELTLALIEYVHYMYSHKVYYVPTAFAEKLMKTDFKINFDLVKLPVPIFELAFDSDFKIFKNYPAQSALISINISDDILAIMQQFLNKAVTNNNIDTEAFKNYLQLDSEIRKEMAFVIVVII